MLLVKRPKLKCLASLLLGSSEQLWMDVMTRWSMWCWNSALRYSAGMENEYVKIVVFAPVEAADAVREALAKAGAGKMGEYDYCSFSVKGVGRFRPSAQANPHIGEVGKIEEVEEERIETICEKSILDEVLEAVQKVHPYEEPAIDVMALL